MQLQGSITALTTPFTESGMLDLGAWRAQIDMQIRSGSQGCVGVVVGDLLGKLDHAQCRLAGAGDRKYM